MQLIKGVMYDDKPEDVVVYPTSVYVTKTCKEIEVEDEQTKEKAIKYECDVEVYEVAEYIDVMQKVNSSLNQQLTDTQVALCDVYEMIAGLM